MAGQGSRGKKTEAAIKKVLEERAKRIDVRFWRWPDARAGSLQAAPCDFLILHAGVTTWLEAKECEFPNRLPYKNADSSQVNSLKATMYAGGKVMILVNHILHGYWRRVPLELLLERNKETPTGSWNIEHLPTGKLEDLLILG